MTKISITLAISAIAFVASVAAGQQVNVQPPTHPETPQWQIDAGGKLEFDVASVKQNRSDQAQRSNVTLDDGNDYPANGGLLSVTRFPLNALIGFAYKLPPYQTRSLNSELPKWAGGDRFDIQVRASSNPTKDQMRLMMQALLADRFKPAAHIETRQLSEFALVLDKPDKMGPHLIPHAADTPCAATATPDGWFMPCGGLGARVESGRMRVGSQNLKMKQVANYLVVAGRLDRPVLDKTGLTGSFDFGIEFTPEPNGPLPPANFEPDASGPTFLEALKDQLGLKLESTTGPVEVLMIDHVEEPTEN